MSSIAPAAQSVLDFWFGAPDSETWGQARSQWFKKSNEFDELIGQNFLPLIDDAIDGGLSDWSDPASAPQARLAYLLLLDQFTRNVYRNKARMYAGDDSALAVALSMVSLGQDQQLPAFQRQFCYLPLEHAEDMACQDRAVTLFQGMDAVTGGDLTSWAVAHRDVVLRFGRFPHRNNILGRENTAEEMQFLSQPGSSF